jgi:DNA-binding CsgD family transcriptional regulator
MSERVNREQEIHLRLRVPCTPSEIAACFELSLPLARAYLYQLRRLGRAVRLNRRVPKANARGRQYEYLWGVP